MPRRLIAVAAAATATTLLLAGCSPTAPTASDTTELTVWFPGNLTGEIEWVNNTVIPEFETEHENVDVTVEFVGWENLSTRLSTAFAGGTAPDVFGHGNAAAAGFAEADRVLNLDTYVRELDAADRDDQVLLQYGQVDGSQYIVPLRGFGQLLAYRTDLLKEAGVEAPSTQDELREAATALTVREGERITRSGVMTTADNPTGMSQSFASFLFQNGGDLLSDDGTQVEWNSAEGIEALSLLAGLYTGENAVATGLNEPTSGTGAQHPLVTGRAAMAFVDDATVKTMFEQAPDVAENIAIAPPLKGTEQASFGGAGNGLFISSDSQQADLAWDFITFMTSKEKAKEYVEVVGGIPARASLANDPDLASKPYIKPYADAVSLFRGNPNVPAWTQVRDVLSTEVEQALSGKKSPKDALNDAAAQAQGLLGK